MSQPQKKVFYDDYKPYVAPQKTVYAQIPKIAEQQQPERLEIIKPVFETPIQPTNVKLEDHDKTVVEQKPVEAGQFAPEPEGLAGLSPSEVMAGLKSGLKVSGAEALNGLITKKDNNLHMKGNIPQPQTFAVCYAVFNFLEDHGFEDVAVRDRRMLEDLEELSLSKSGKSNRADKLIDAFQKAFGHDLEVEKAKAKSVLGRS